MKINEGQLKQIIRESLNEFRGGLSYNDYDGDNHYVRPNGQLHISNDNFKTMYNNSSYGEKSGKRTIERGADRYPNMFSYGKGKLCLKIISELKKTFQVECTGYSAKQTGKINWTENELKLISDIHNNLMQLARLSKTEGAKTRGQVPNVAESKLNDIIKESLKKVLNESRFAVNYPANTIENTIWNKFDLPWNEVDDNAEEHKGIWYITVDYFDYTEHLGNAEIDRQFGTLEECLNFAQHFTIEDAYELCNEEITDEGFSSISLNIMCQENRGTYEVANTKMFMPKEHSRVNNFGDLEGKSLNDLFK